MASINRPTPPHKTNQRTHLVPLEAVHELTDDLKSPRRARVPVFVERPVPAPLQVEDGGELAALHQVLVLKGEVAGEAHILFCFFFFFSG